MARPVLPPRLYWDDERQSWCILDRGKRERLGLPHGAVEQARVRLAEYVIEQAKGRPEATGRAAADVTCDEVLERYLARRTDDDPAVRVKAVARPEELRQRIRLLARGFGGVSVGDIAERAEVGRTTFFRHFGDKQEVVFANEQALLDAIERRLAAS